jgi:hypothetical protein
MKDAAAEPAASIIALPERPRAMARDSTSRVSAADRRTNDGVS